MTYLKDQEDLFSGLSRVINFSGTRYLLFSSVYDKNLKLGLTDGVDLFSVTISNDDFEDLKNSASIQDSSVVLDAIQ